MGAFKIDHNLRSTDCPPLVGLEERAAEPVGRVIGEWCSLQQTYTMAKRVFVELDRLWKNGKKYIFQKGTEHEFGTKP